MGSILVPDAVDPVRRRLRWDTGLSMVLHNGYTRSMRTISQRELRNDSGQVLRDVEAGHTMVVTRRGTPVARITPLDQPAPGHRPARLPAEFSLADLLEPDVSSEELLADLRDDR